MREVERKEYAARHVQEKLMVNTIALPEPNTEVGGQGHAHAYSSGIE